MIKNSINEDVIDVSNNCGRKIVTRGMTFLAAPIMWLGDRYFEVVPKDEFLDMRFASQEVYGSNNVVYLKLFDLYDSPSNDANRAIQKEFLEYLKLRERIQDFENRNPFDAIKWLIAKNQAKTKDKRSR